MFRVYAHGLAFLFCLLLTFPVLAAPEISGEFSETEAIGGGQYRTTIHSAPIAFKDAQGKLQRISTAWSDGDAEFPNVVTTSKLRVKMAPDGMRRIYPIPGDDSKYMEIGAPLVKNASGMWIKPAFTGPTKAGNKLTWTNPNALLSIVHAGHFMKLDIELLGGWLPRDGQFAFPVGLQGLTRSGTLIKDGEKVVSVLRAPVAYDAANPGDVRKITNQFVSVDGQHYILFTLPDLTGMNRPVVDPTLTLQPDGAGYDAVFLDVAPSTNYGSATTIHVGEFNTGSTVYRSAIKFDLSTLPTNAIISSTTLSLYAVTDYSSNARTFRVYRLKRAWVEAEVTWNIWATASNWSTAGAFHTDDCEQTDIGSRAFSSTETLNEFKNFALTPTTKFGLDLGNGWLIKADTETDDSYQFSTSDDATAENRPKLVIVYTIPPAHRPIIISSLWDWMRYVSMN